MSVGRALTWPLRRLLDPRFRGLAEQADAIHHDLAMRNDELIRRSDHALEAQRAEHEHTLETLGQLRHLVTVDMDAATEAATTVGVTLSELSDSLEKLREWLDPASSSGRSVDELTATAAELVNYASSHRGFAAQKGLWFNPPAVLAHRAGDVRVDVLTERIVEVPYVLRGLRDTAAGSRILDVGANESTLAVSLASLGYDVTALDLTPYPFQHPSLAAAVSPIESWRADEPYDVAICLSTVEHIGVGAYTDEAGDEGADLAAMRRIRELLRAEGTLLLTAPYAARARTLETERLYDRASLERLLEGWTLEDVTVAVRESPLVWRVAGDAEPPDDARAVALVTARPGT